MKFIYGKQDWKTFERGEENCYLMTNGLGGFSSLTAIGSCGRNDHAVLMACIKAPNHRYNMIHRLEELLHFGEESIHISSQDFRNHEDGTKSCEECDAISTAEGCTEGSVRYRNGREEGYLYQTCFSYEDYPQWSYLVKGVEIRKTIVLMECGNGVGIS